LPGLYLGPFTTPRVAYWAINALKPLFPLRTCEGAILPDAAGSDCLYGQMGRCSAPCVDRVTHGEYREMCDDLVQLLQTGASRRLEARRDRMRALADAWRFEDAARVRRELDAIEIVATRLARIGKLRATLNVAIVQPAKASDSHSSLFLVRGGVVRRHLQVDWSCLSAEVGQALREVYEMPEPAGDPSRRAGAAPPLPGDAYVSKAELDEMLIMDRWLKAHGAEKCCVWIAEKRKPRWVESTIKALRQMASSVS
jgi:excinuclease ABC subunit C